MAFISHKQSTRLFLQGVWRVKDPKEKIFRATEWASRLAPTTKEKPSGLMWLGDGHGGWATAMIGLNFIVFHDCFMLHS